ncbi:MAG TPA: hypothetical protein VG013_41130 [Gemmataceae bacterium]|jgi:hypothetical protein|nr:hypothetical protein [Gemmataceae bacterium]
MRPFRTLGWVCALGLLAAAASPVGAAWGDAVPVCDHCCNHAAYCPPPPTTTLYVQRSCYEPVTCYQPAPCEPCPRRCGPIRRLLRRCCRVPVAIFRPSCYYEPVPVCAPPPCAPPACRSCGCAPVPAPVIVPGPAPCAPGGPVYAPPSVPRPVPPAVSEQPPPAFGGPEPDNGEQISPSPPSSPAPPINGSSYKPLTPPLPPPPVPLNHVVSWPRWHAAGKAHLSD